MRYEVNLTVTLKSDQTEDRVCKLFESLFDFGTIKESIADGLHLLEDPRLLAITAKPARKRR